jgi:protein-S-isoprenylcysteine O-methyltransferase Ste14
MTTFVQRQIEYFPWYVFAIYWAVTAIAVKRTKARETSADRIATIIVMVLAYEMLFSQLFRVGVLGDRFVPSATWIFWLGFAISSLGIAVAIWARACLGKNWSARVTLKEGHELIRSGPYRFIRHPIYTGMLLGACGTAIEIGEWRGVLAVLLMTAAHSRKAMREENLLRQEFGEDYTAYRKSTGFLFPRFWSA